MSHEFDIEHGGEAYWVEVEFDRTYEDDSFNCHIGGRDGVHKCGHWEADLDTLEVISCKDGEGDEIDPEFVPGLMACIASHVRDLDQ